MKKVSSVVLLSLLCLITMAVGKVKAMDSFLTASAEYNENEIDTRNSTDNPIETIAPDLEEMMNMVRGTYECLMKRIKLMKYELDLLLQNITAARYRITMIDCSDVLEFNITSGFYTFYMDTGDKNPVRVYCDLVTEGGGWTAIQIRQPAAENVTFERKWNEYLKGFGSPETHHFVGLSNIYTWMLTRIYELRVNVRDHEGGQGFSKYQRFHLEGEHCGYRMMQFVETGPAGDSLEFAVYQDTEPYGDEISIHHGMKFSTIDRDSTKSNCSQKYKSGWWFSDNCGASNLNGPYLPYGQHQDGINGVWWKTFSDASLYSCSMMIRPRYPINTIFKILFKPIYLHE